MSSVNTKVAVFRSVGYAGPNASLGEKLVASVKNSGNLLFQEAIINQIETDLVVNSWRDVTEDVSTLVLTLANFVNPAVDVSDLVGKLEKSRIDKILLVGIGAQSYFYDADLKVSPSALRLLSIASERSKLIGVRGFYTAELLKKNGIKNVEVMGCPSVFESLTQNYVVPSRSDTVDERRMAIHTTPSGHFRDKNSDLFKFAMRHAADYVLQNEPTLLPLLEARNLTDKEEASIVFFCRYYNDGTFSPVEMRLWLAEHIKIFFNVQEWESYLASRSMVIGARFHGNVASMRAGTPSITLFFDSRTRELCEYLGMPSMPFDDFDSSLSPQEYYDFANYENFNAGFKRKYMNYVNFLDSNEVPHRLERAVDDVPANYPSGLFGDLVERLPFSDKIQLLSVAEQMASKTGKNVSAMDMLGIFSRLRAERSEVDRNLAEKSAAGQFHAAPPSFRSVG